MMSIVRGCAAVAASAMVAAAAAGLTPEQVSAGRSPAQVALTATTIPIVDFDQTFGPLSLLRKLTATFDQPVPTTRRAILQALSETGWAGPLGFGADVDWRLNLPAQTDHSPGIVASATLNPSLQGGFAVTPLGPGGPNVAASGQISTYAIPALYLGGSEGLGAGLTGMLEQGNVIADAELPGVGTAKFNSGGYLGYIPESRLVVFPGGLKAVLSTIPFAGGVSGTVTAGSSKITGFVTANLLASGSVCTGSAVAGCGGIIAEASVSTFPFGTVKLTAPAGTTTATLDLPNRLTLALKPDRLALTGQIGGTVTVNSMTFGGVVPVNIQIPFGTPLPLAATPTPLRESPKAVPAHPVRPTGAIRTPRPAAAEAGARSSESRTAVTDRGTGKRATTAHSGRAAQRSATD